MASRPFPAAGRSEATPTIDRYARQMESRPQRIGGQDRGRL